MLDILAIGVHPDDVEIACCGTVLRHLAQGYRVGILDLTQGELGTRGSAPLRLQEAQAAAELMGISVRENIELADGFFQPTREATLDIIRVIRHWKPKIVLCNSLSDRHPDHGRSAKLVADACFYAGLPKIETQRDGIAQSAHRPAQVYHYIQDYNLVPDFVVDISPYMPHKLEIIRAYKSQFFDPNSSEPNTPISGKDFLLFVEAKARTFGRPCGFEYAEGFNVARTIGVSDLFNLL